MIIIIKNNIFEAEEDGESIDNNFSHWSNVGIYKK
jgi:hypothetical protein